MVLATWQVGQFVWSMLWFTLFFMWIYTVVYVLRDVFRSRDLSGVAKAAWTIFVMYLPVVGVLAYLIARGDSIGEHLQQDEAARNAATHSTIRTAVTMRTPASASPATARRSAKAARRGPHCRSAVIRSRQNASDQSARCATTSSAPERSKNWKYSGNSPHSP